MTFKSPKQALPKGKGLDAVARDRWGSSMYMQGTGNSTTELRSGAKTVDT